jgi:predicted nucleotidyltransferase
MKSSEVLERSRQAICEATMRFNAANPRFFGSVARGDDRPDCDFDILVDALPGSSLLTLGGLQAPLEQMMPRTPVHLLTPSEFPGSIRARVLQEAKPI